MSKEDRDAMDLFKTLKKLIDKFMRESASEDGEFFINEPDFKAKVSFGSFPLPIPGFPMQEISLAESEGLCDDCPAYEECHGSGAEFDDLELGLDTIKNFVELNEDEKMITIIVEFPGMNKEDFNFKFNGKILRIIACRKVQEVRLPCKVDESRISARYQNGILELKLTKIP